MLKILTIFTCPLLIFCLPLISKAQNPCSELTAVLSQPTPGEKKLEQTFSPGEGKFKINLPPTKPVEPELINGRKSTVRMTRYRWFTLNRGSFEVSYLDGERRLDDASISKTILDNLRNALMSKGEGKLETDKDLFLDNFPGREIKIKDAKGINIARFYLVEKRLYSVSAFIPIKLECAVGDVTKTLDSFELVTEK